MATERQMRAAFMAAEWWGARLMQGDVDAFKDFLGESIARKFDEGETFIRLSCDYDPQGDLLEAVRAAGVECGGFMFSARGILPQKTDLTVREDRLEPKEGYGNWTAHIPVTP